MDTTIKTAACDDDCPVKATAQVIEGKWTTLILRELLQGTKRYSELQRALAGISPKVLAQRLRHLEQRRILTRTVYPTVPPTTEYALTDLGRKLEGVVSAMASFGTALQQTESRAAKVASK